MEGKPRRKYSELSGIERVLATLGMVRWAFPIVLLPINFGLPPALASIGLQVPDFDWYLFVFNILALVVWLGAEGWTLIYRYTSSGALIIDTVVSILLALALTYYLRDNLGDWRFYTPWAGTAIDALIAAVLAINNAAQKPLIHDIKAKH